MKLIALIVAAVAAAAAAVAYAAAPPVADDRGLAVAQSGRIYVEGRPVARGAQPVWSPDGRFIAYARAGEIYVADADGRNERRLTRTAQPVHSPAWSPDGRTIAFAGVRDVFTVPSRGGAVRNLTRSPRPWLIRTTPAYSPLGQTLAISASTDAFNSDIFLIRADGTGMRRLTRTQGTHDRFAEESMPAFSRDGRRVVYVSNRDRGFDLYSIGVDGRGERRLTRTPRRDEMHPRFSPDGRRILFARDGRIVEMRAGGGGERELGAGTSADLRPPLAPPVARGPGLAVAFRGRLYVEGQLIGSGYEPAWSPDATRVAFGRRGQIYVADRDGGNEVRLTFMRRPASYPAWSPDGRTIAFVAGRDVYAVPAQGGRVRRLTHSRTPWQLYGAPSFSPDGRTLAIGARTDALNSDIYVVRPDGSGMRRVTRTVGTRAHPRDEWMPEFSPDGRQIAFTSNRHGKGDLFVIGVDGSGERRLTFTPNREELYPRYSPDGAMLLFSYDGRIAQMSAQRGRFRDLGPGSSADWT